ncbi:hypothetical protein CVT26_013302 [Gymnopilus dilepis]|uniref:Uncharacterized protein n=1 Tax=Gymnopilus dilepis TaxID=231916 RepID=A0A409VUN6_9AGAR|nr:hypothetical protein CVT26_013302 [Gymnopilus dilepis]
MTTATTSIAGINPPRIRRASIPTHTANPQPDQHPHPRRASAVDHQTPEKDAEPEEGHEQDIISPITPQNPTSKPTAKSRRELSCKSARGC